MDAVTKGKTFIIKFIRKSYFLFNRNCRKTSKTVPKCEFKFKVYTMIYF